MKMNPLKLSDLARIVIDPLGPCVTLVLSAGETGIWSPEALARFEEMLRDAEAQLAAGYPETKRGQFLKMLHEFKSLKHNVPDAGAICLFASMEMAYYLPLAAEGERFSDKVCVGNSFQISYILDDINPMKSWYMAKMTKTGMLLYRGRGRTLENIGELNVGRDRSLPPHSGAKKEPPRFVKFTSEEHETLDAFIEARIEASERAFPIVLAGAKTDTDGYCKDTLLNFDLVVNFSERYTEFSPARLLTTVWPKLSDYFDQDRKMAIAGLVRAQQCGLTTSDLRQVLAKLNSGSLRLMAILRESQAGKLVLAQDYDTLVRRAIEKGCKILFCSPSELPLGMTLLAV